MQETSGTMHHFTQQLTRVKDLLAKALPRTRKQIVTWVLFSALVLVGVLAIVRPTFALIDFDTIVNGIIYAASWLMMGIASFFIKMTIFFLQLFILIAGYNNYIDAPVVKLGWNMIRDITNMFFVVALLVIAFGTILGVESYEWRKLLPKLLLAALLVNFSNLICQLIIDIAQVFTTTFLNAVAGVAGGNLIQMFNFEEIYKISTGEDSMANYNGQGLRLEFFISAVIAVTFAAIAMIAMFAYTIVVTIRMVVLWTLIILSPIGFVFSALPATKKYADEFWSEFFNYVVAAPIMVFFLWLSFATFGGGNVVGEHIEKDHPISNAGVTNRQDTDGRQVSAGISRAASYDRMANFAVALAFMLMGLERVQKLGVKGGGLVSGAVNFGKNVATVFSGVKLAQWAGGGIKDATVDFGKDHLKILKGGTVDRLRHAPGVSKIPILGAAGKVKRKAKIAKQEEYFGEKKKQWEAQVKGGNGGLLGPSRKAMAKARIAAENAEREQKAQNELDEGQMRVNMVLGDKKKWMKEVEKEMEKAKAANNGQEVSREQEAAIRKRVAKKYTQTRLAHMEGEAGAKQAKQAKETQILQALGKDSDRLSEGKLAKAMRGMEDADFNDDITEFARMSYDDRAKEMEREIRRIKEFQAEYDGMDDKQKDSDAGKDLKRSLKNAQRNAMLLLTSAHEQGEGNDLMQYAVMPTLAEDDAAWNGVEWNKEQNYGRVMMAAITGRSFNDLANGITTQNQTDSEGNAILGPDGNPLQEQVVQWDGDAAANFEAQARKQIGDKWNLTMRGLMRAMNSSAGKTTNPHQSNQVRVGVNEAGQEVLGFSDNLQAGKFGSGNRMASGHETRDGSAIRGGKQEFAAGEIQTLSDVKDGRALLGADVDGKAIGLDEKSISLLRSIGGMNAGEIRRLHKSILNMASGGSYEKSTFDADLNAFNPGETMGPIFREIIDQMRDGISSSEDGSTTQDRRMEALQELMRKMTGKIMEVGRDGTISHNGQVVNIG